MSALRVFLAVRPGEEVTRTLGTLQRRLQRMGVRCRWTSQDHLHLTLLFLGEVPGEAVETLAALVPPVAGLHAAFDMRLSGLGAFPGLRHAHVLWAGVARGTAELIALQTDLDRALTEAGLYAGDRFDFRPHVTLGRLPRPANLAALAEPYADWDGGVCPVDCVAVMASDLSQGRPRYTELCRARLGAPPAD
jgi:2'-5' RNA ligase